MKLNAMLVTAILLTVGLINTLAREVSDSKAVAPLPSPKAEVRIDHNFDDPARRDNFTTVTRNIVAVFETLVAPQPVPGLMPFVITPSTDGMPRANIGQHQYNVIVTCLDEPWASRLSYQFGHELGHYWIGPYSTSWFKECVCTALSFVSIDELAKYWKHFPPTPWCAEWADNLRDYHDRRTFQLQLDGLGLKDLDAAMIWARENGPKLLETGAGLLRDEEQVIAKVIERVLRRHPGQWAALQKLGDVTGKMDAEAFKKWYSLVLPDQQALVEDIAASLGCPIGQELE